MAVVGAWGLRCHLPFVFFFLVLLLPFMASPDRGCLWRTRVKGCLDDKAVFPVPHSEKEGWPMWDPPTTSRKTSLISSGIPRTRSERRENLPPISPATGKNQRRSPPFSPAAAGIRRLPPSFSRATSRNQWTFHHRQQWSARSRTAVALAFPPPG
jgi:hypothetical protein